MITTSLMISGMVTEYSQTMTARIKIKLHHRRGTVNLLFSNRARKEKETINERKFACPSRKILLLVSVASKKKLVSRKNCSWNLINYQENLLNLPLE